MNRVFNSLLLTIAVSAIFAGPARADRVVIDTNHDGWIWSGMTEYDDPALAAGVGRAGGPGTYGAYTFSGTSLAVVMMKSPTVTVDGRSHRAGKVKIAIDGFTKAVEPLYADTASGNDVVYSTETLPPGNHVVELTAIDGWIVVDHITLNGAAEQPAAAAPLSSEFRDDFRNGDLSRWTPYGGEWGISGGYYAVRAGGGFKSVVTDTNFTDLDYRADVIVGQSSGDAGDAGLIFRVQHPNVGTDSYSGYYAGIDIAQQRVILGKANNSWTMLASAPFRVQALVPYHVRVTAIGPNITVSVGDMPVLHFTDDSFASGAIGLRTFNVDAGWTDIVVTHP